MQNVFKKEFQLVVMPLSYVLMFISLMLLIPHYTGFACIGYVLFFMYITLGPANENRDNTFSLMLPISRSKIVLGRIYTVIYLEIMQLIIAIPFALISRFIVNPQGNYIFFNLNPAFFGFVLITFSIFNLLFLPSYFKRGFKPGINLFFAVIGFLISAAAIELIFQYPPFKTTLASINPEYLPYQLIALIIGIAIFVLTTFLAYKISAKEFEKVDL